MQQGERLGRNRIGRIDAHSGDSDHSFRRERDQRFRAKVHLTHTSSEIVTACSIVFFCLPLKSRKRFGSDCAPNLSAVPDRLYASLSNPSGAGRVRSVIR